MINSITANTCEKKTLKGMQKFGCGFGQYVTAGDYIDQELLEDLMDFVPTSSSAGEYMQAGEPCGHMADGVGAYWLTYHTFRKERDGQWRYLGIYPAGGVQDADVKLVGKFIEPLKKKLRRKI